MSAVDDGHLPRVTEVTLAYLEDSGKEQSAGG